MTGWAALAIYYSDLGAEPLRLGLAAAFVLGTRRVPVPADRRRTLVGFGAAFAIVLLWWLSIAPSNERDWQPEVAVLPYATRMAIWSRCTTCATSTIAPSRITCRATTIAPSICASWTRSI